MCTAITVNADDFYFGRTLDYHRSFGECVVITPRNFPLPFRKNNTLSRHFALLGMATVRDGLPLYYEAANEHGLCAAGLLFPKNAHYFEERPDRLNLAPFEIIPFVLAQCKNLREARQILEQTNICALDFSPDLPSTPLHWLFADRSGALTVESVASGLKIYENPVGVLTNNPPFSYHLLHLCDYLNLSPYEPNATFSNAELSLYGSGLGAKGLPGDGSSTSRFVRAAFFKEHATVFSEESDNVGQFFHLLDSVYQIDGCNRISPDTAQKTLYASCLNATRGVYYYTTYQNRTVSAVYLRRENLERKSLCCFELLSAPVCVAQN